eukprot:3738831-Lingulodinium_polyedra.AAC.1
MPSSKVPPRSVVEPGGGGKRASRAQPWSAPDPVCSSWQSRHPWHARARSSPPFFARESPAICTTDL